MGGLWSELKRRNVVKVAIAYCAAGWVVVQIAALLFPLFGAPAWILKVVTTLVFLGLPLALVFAWAFELTPQGIKRTEDVARGAATPRRDARPLNLLIVGVVAVAVGLFALDRFVGEKAAPATAARVADESASASPQPAAGTHSSIAVLPFVNMSNDPDQDYFSDGIAEDLMSALARFKALKVAARTSAFSFKGKQVDLHEVGHALNVATVLEGSVRRSGDHLRITAQLNDVATGYQLWSETYDRQLTDIFAIQDDITSRIVSALQVHLDEEPSQAASVPVDPEVYQSVLRGRFYWNQRTPEGFAKAAALLQDATRLAPEYAPAYSALADVYLSQYDYGLMSWEESTVKARAAATKALELDDTSAAAQTSLAHILLHEWQWQAAEQHFLRALELDPNYTLALHWYALCLTALGRTDEAVEVMERARQLDPLSVRINADLGMALLAAGKHEEAVAQEGRALKLAAEAAVPRWIRGMAFEQLGRFDAAERDMKAALDAMSGYEAVKGSLGHLYAISGRQAEARRLLGELTSQADTTDVTFFAALICAGLGDDDGALTWLERAVEKRSGSVRYLKIDPRLSGLRDEPRYLRLMEGVGLPR
jgi:TolB-like protein/tetratricopeptide (TPR) repeat protein